MRTDVTMFNWAGRLRWVAVGAVAGVGAVASAVAAATPDEHSGYGYAGSGEPVVEVVADGLDNPRGLTITYGGEVLVAEAGSGGDGACIADPEDPDGEVCLGSTGAVSRFDPASGATQRIVSGLPSLAGPDGSFASGLTDVSVGPRGLLGIIGMGGDPAVRETLGPDGALLAHVVQLAQDGAESAEAFGDLGAFEAANDPDGAGADTNPYSLVAYGGGAVAVDAGGNTLVRVDRFGQVHLLAVFPAELVPAPDFLELPPGTEIPMDAVPTTVVRGPDGAYYVGQLTGFPFPVAGAKVWRVVPGQEPEVYAEGFTNIIGIDFDRQGRLWVLEITTNSLLSGDPTGALIRVEADGTRTEIAPGELTFPGGLAVAPDGSVYVTNQAVFAGAGQLLRIQP